tara:strand:+ start:549 stop:779 length:231 start_codon:yes stop_codon:yes gene_type:complete
MIDEEQFGCRYCGNRGFTTWGGWRGKGENLYPCTDRNCKPHPILRLMIKRKGRKNIPLFAGYLRQLVTQEIRALKK